MKMSSEGNGSTLKLSSTTTAGSESSSRLRKSTLLTLTSTGAVVVATKGSANGLINEDFCTYCKEGGNLLNCDRCPSSFHFLCHEPPLDPDDIPKGEFLCNKCRYETQILADLAVSQQPQPAASRYTGGGSSGLDKRPHHNDLLLLVKNPTDTTMDVLMRMASAFNPGQMRLSKGITCKYDTNMPGTNRFRLYHKALNAIDPAYFKPLGGLFENTNTNETDQIRKSTNDTFTSSEKSKNSDKKNDHVNRKNIKFCYICNKSIKADRLLSCDFCPLTYDSDCIFALIDVVPNIKDKFWMCPCHAEHLIDQKLLTSDRLTERIKLWSHFRINDSAQAERIKRDFFLRCRKFCAGDDETTRTLSAKPTSIPEEIVCIYDRHSNSFLNGSLTEADIIAIEALEMLKNPFRPEPEKKMEIEQENKDMIRLIATLDGQNRSVRALLHQLSPSRDSTVCINSGKTISVGIRRIGMDVCLRGLVPLCRALSDKHAIIYHDNITGLFELLNYSEFGTLVDGCVYNSNIDADEDMDFWADRNQGVDSDSFKDSCFCRCRLEFGGSRLSHRSIEGPAVLKHGSVIQFGCVKFLFVIVQDSVLMKPTSSNKKVKIEFNNKKDILKGLRNGNFRKLKSNENLPHRSLASTLIGDSNKAALL